MIIGKHTYSNALTGKISDFAGVFVMAIFLVACFGFTRIYAAVFTALFFAWYKSPLSDPIISTFYLARVIDYSDLIALTMLPLVFFLKPFHYGQWRLKYAIPFAMDTITNIRFRFYDKGKRRVLDVMEIIIPPDLSFDYFTERTVRKKYKADEVVYA